MPVPASPIELVDPRRSAHASIRGYLYQACLGVERWLSLGKAEVLLCEGDEDLDCLLLEKGLGVIEQIKAGAKPVGDVVLRESLQRFAITYVALRQRGENRRFVFTTTAERTRSGRRFNSLDPMSYWAEERKDRSPEEQESYRSAIRRWLTLGEASADKDGDAFRRSLAGAIDWLNVVERGWEEFLDNVEWRFGSPDLEAIRTAIGERLRKRPDAGVLPLGSVLVDWLVAQVMEASSRPKPEDRVLTLEKLERLLASVAGELEAWSGRRPGTQLREAFEELSGLGRLLTAGTRSLPQVHPDNAQGGGCAAVPPGKLLTAAYEVVPFEEYARAGELADLKAWCNDDRVRSVWLWTGETGSGKTRLAIELCRRLASDGWEAGFLREDNYRLSSFTLLARGVLPRLIVIDEAETRLEVVKALLTITGETLQEPPKLRLLLLARRSGAWWGLIKKNNIKIEDLLLSSPGPRLIQPLTEGDAILKSYRHAFAAFCELKGRELPAPPLPPALPPAEARIPVFLHMRALEALESGISPNTNDLISRLLDRERELWRLVLQDLKGSHGYIPFGAEEIIEKTMAWITSLRGVSSRAEAELVAEAAAGPLTPETRTVVIEVLHRLYSDSKEGGHNFVQALQPDLLAEELVAQILGGPHD